MEDQVEHCECQALNNAQAACMMVALLSTTHPPKPGDDLSSFSQVPRTLCSLQGVTMIHMGILRNIHQLPLCEGPDSVCVLFLE